MLGLVIYVFCASKAQLESCLKNNDSKLLFNKSWSTDVIKQVVLLVGWECLLFLTWPLKHILGRHSITWPCVHIRQHSVVDFSYWHALLCMIDWQTRKLHGSGSENWETHLCRWVICTEPLYSSSKSLSSHVIDKFHATCITIFYHLKTNALPLKGRFSSRLEGTSAIN